MIVTVEAARFRCLKHVQRPLDQFHILVGPNAGGKTTFFDVVRFLSDLVSNGLDYAIAERSENLKDLIWRREGDRFELAVELAIPQQYRKTLENPAYNACRYEVAIGLDPATEENAILEERGQLLTRKSPPLIRRALFPEISEPPTTILKPLRAKGVRVVVHKVPGGHDNFYNETGKGRAHVFKLGLRRPALGTLPDDETRFPVSVWLKRFLAEGIQSLVLNSALMRRPSPPGQPRRFKPDGSNLPWVVEDLKNTAPARLGQWVSHLRTALPDLEAIDTVQRPEDRTRYLVVRYQGGLRVPSWMVSDGTLRLLALTLPAYIPDLQGVYLIEEPENGIHPRAVETLFQSLSSVYEAQILLATHSPVILSLAEPAQVLCFAPAEDGATDIVRGSEHPALRDWKGETNLGTLYAGGVLG